MNHEKKRRAKRHRSSMEVEFYVYSSKIISGKTALKDISAGGLRLEMKKAPFPETVIVIRGDRKKMEKFIDFDTILLDTDGNPIVRVVHVTEDEKKKIYHVGVRFLERPAIGTPPQIFDETKGSF
jgi:c-di-GMP-binding flagellar brake protein YcgR